MKKDRYIFHIDINYFFARCEEILNPYLETKPFCIANREGHSVIATSNLLARKFGVKSAMLVSNAKKLCSDIITVEPHSMYYKKKSDEFFQCIKDHFTDQIEIMSIDECFIDVTDMLSQYHDNVDILASSMIKTIFRETKLHVTVGIGDNKFLAKMAGDTKPVNKIAKLYKSEIKTKLWPKPIDSCINVGQKTSAYLKSLGINTVEQFLKYENQAILEAQLHKKYFQLLECFLGQSDEHISFQEDAKSYSQSRTFHIALNNKYEVYKQLKFLCDEVSHQLCKNDLCGSRITLNYRWDQQFKNKTKSITINDYLWSSESINNVALQLLSSIWDEQTPIKLIGVSVSNLIKISDISSQITLF